MALYKQTSGQLPPGAIKLSRDEAIHYQMNAIKQHFPQSETYFLQYGSWALGFAACTSGFWIQNFYRRQFLLRSEGVLSTVLPSSFLPGVLSSLLQFERGTVPIILQEAECPLCALVRAGMIQTAVGFVWPLILSPLAAVMSASRYRTFTIPKSLKETFRLVLSESKPGMSKFLFIAAMQFVVAVGITEKAQQEFFYMHRRRELRKEDKQIVYDV